MTQLRVTQFVRCWHFVKWLHK